MTVYDDVPHRASPGGDGSARSSDATPIDPRLDAFSELLKSIDACDWRAGQAATRKLRALGISCCLIKPPGDRRGA